MVEVVVLVVVVEGVVLLLVVVVVVVEVVEMVVEMKLDLEDSLLSFCQVIFFMNLSTERPPVYLPLLRPNQVWKMSQTCEKCHSYHP